MIRCPSCIKTMTQKGKDRLMRSHAREVRKRDWVCECGAKLRTEERRYPGEQFVLHRKV
jgi:C4-type Zn-finger protein